MLGGHETARWGPHASDWWQKETGLARGRAYPAGSTCRCKVPADGSRGCRSELGQR
jgi:hypothetical protein